ncbi:MAG: Crp/Fnr family transcriptional regulator [Desulfobacterium sp.]|nr:Crp/Fnr family transcriptional regulator [Desulfobacterium sp.]
MQKFTREDKQTFLSFFSLCRGLPRESINDIVEISDFVVFPENMFISTTGDGYNDILFVISGLLRISMNSSSGRRVTVLLVKSGECYNLLTPYLDYPRNLEAQALEPTRCLRVLAKDFTPFVEKHPAIVPNLLRIVGSAFDSANSRILEFMEKRVEARIKRVLSTLHGKFTSPLHFTSVQISELACTTPESTLRAMGHLRDMGIIETRPGQIWVLNPSALMDLEFGDLII